jgi:predicted DNA-binding transcriptional regulator AlpA
MSLDKYPSRKAELRQGSSKELNGDTAMRNLSRPHPNVGRSAAAKFPAVPTSFSGDALPDAPEMFNILLALESARGLLTVRDVAKFLHKSKYSIYRMAEKRQIPSLVIGGSRFFDPSVLALWLSKKEPSLAAAARRFKAA